MPSKDIVISPQEIGIKDFKKNDWTSGAEKKIIEKLTEYILENKENLNIQRGDTVSLLKQQDKYRNEWTFMWDGEKVIELYSDYDEYGSVPPSIQVTDTEFSPDW